VKLLGKSGDLFVSQVKVLHGPRYGVAISWREGRLPVTRIDRLARSTFNLLPIVKRIVDAEVQFRSFAEP
jgi:hypothetical protein